MRRSVLLVLGILLSQSSAQTALAIELQFTGTLSLKAIASSTLPEFVVQRVGVADAVLDGSNTLTGINFPSGVFSTQGQVIAVTDPNSFPILGLIATMANDAGAFGSGPTGFGGVMPLRGVVKVCLFGTCDSAPSFISVPLSVVGRNTTVNVSGPLNLTVAGAPWTTGTIELRSYYSSAPTVMGSRQTDTLNLVTPIFISTNISASAVVDSYVRLVAFFNPPAGDYCNHGPDDDGDGLTDFPDDPGCESPEDPSERIDGAPCDDGLDNDGDHRIDAFDPGCDGPLDESEQSPTLVCDDGLDNDGDGVTDFPSDTGCDSPSDPSEKGTRACDDGIDTDGDGLIDFPADPGCSSSADRSERGPGRVCDDDIDDDGDGTADFPGDAGCASIDDPSERSAGFVCDDGLDQDGDGRADFPADPGCSGPLDPSERSALLICDDRLDNDFDGTSDYPGDPGCSGPADPSEQSASLACDNGLDDDGDGLIDSQQDPGCTGPADPRESADLADGAAHQIDAANPSPDHSLYLGSGDPLGAITSLWLGPGGVIGGNFSATTGGYFQMDAGAIGGDLLARGDAHLVIRGGTIGGHLDARDSSRIEIHGSDFDLPLGEVLATSGTITGFLLDGSVVAIAFTRGIGATIELVPEPAASAAALIALATLVAVRTRRARGE
jgi:hypothetical protein